MLNGTKKAVPQHERFRLVAARPLTVAERYFEQICSFFSNRSSTVFRHSKITF